MSKRLTVILDDVSVTSEGVVTILVGKEGIAMTDEEWDAVTKEVARTLMNYDPLILLEYVSPITLIGCLLTRAARVSSNQTLSSVTKPASQMAGSPTPSTSDSPSDKDEKQD